MYSPNTSDNYGGRASGLLVPPVTGEYIFYLSSNNQSQLFLGDSESAKSEKRIAYIRENERRVWRRPRHAAGNQWRPSPIYLERGKRYSIRALFKGSQGEEHLAVAWQMPGQPPLINGDPPIPGLFLRPRRE